MARPKKNQQDTIAENAPETAQGRETNAEGVIYRPDGAKPSTGVLDGNDANAETDDERAARLAAQKAYADTLARLERERAERERLERERAERAKRRQEEAARAANDEREKVIRTYNLLKATINNLEEIKAEIGRGCKYKMYSVEFCICGIERNLTLTLESMRHKFGQVVEQVGRLGISSDELGGVIG